ncbi:26S proteasome non-ATPase regulatory subunit 9 [Belonocnema kinseyi]|uniref:26S proteasome non-ATPase regulatory subunit 9 n=1 Tax=Belonocnema kinseyi TaxID=2817044 RepID=UPI00143DFD2B|nr:26S proteasome non-ATPase regulatory subunit 9 [Belonocnema kinseyi]
MQSILRRKMVVDMEVEQAKKAVLQLMAEKDKIERDLKDAHATLESNHVGMNDALVDSAGYPRADIDVYQVRHARHKIICLQNDYKAIMKKIEEGLHKVHGLSGISVHESSTAEAAPSAVQESVYLEPFLRVNLVTPGSPAASAGIQVEDLILEFGSINYQNFSSLQDVGSLVANSVNKELIVRVKRDCNTLVLTLIPRPWNGKGLLGCNVVPLETVER